MICEPAGVPHGSANKAMEVAAGGDACDLSCLRLLRRTLVQLLHSEAQQGAGGIEGC